MNAHFSDFSRVLLTFRRRRMPSAYVELLAGAYRPRDMCISAAQILERQSLLLANPYRPLLDMLALCPEILER
jgi:hypothetical protein